MKLDPETLEQLINEGLISFEQAEALRIREQKLLNPHLIPNIRARENHAAIAKMQQFVPEDSEQGTCVGDALTSLQRNDDEVVVILLDIMRRLLTSEDTFSSNELFSNEPQTLTRIVTALLPIIVTEGPKAELAALNMNKLQRGFSPAGIVTPEMHEAVIRWVQNLMKKPKVIEEAIDDIGVKSLQYRDGQLIEPDGGEDLFLGAKGSTEDV
jgi:hypothetical protein